MSLREQKKLETRQNISHAATRLFIERGFEVVTIADVAEAARVAKMTVTNHFGRKEDLVFDIRNDFVDWPAKLVLADRSVPPFAAVRDGYFAALEKRSALLGFAGIEFVRMVRESEKLVSALAQMHLDRERALVAELVALDRRDEILPRAAGAHLTSVLRLLFDDVWDLTYAGAGADDLATKVHDSATKAFAQLEPALG
ncbi:TetR/AcrR family transcriptional regulator [Amycolatopsis sp. FDAARGOS 1241]|uniref:TetR/AcrR family transcriptional regulator n=1 Tax=Amycolatopsis sp. FDAARGOS 1241 TaxID=2778070 RepID=UPI00194EFBFF|nr:TetR/AcrR family transcriptional regulator [Amycolatopsis sp. FDAARGOS 1241]QRP45907.1 TetR/AcrR family transcriptional regulator [Amycolatopsis sp. FDAARGOS 1241]